MRTFVPGGNEPAGALTATLPSASGKAKTRASGLKLGGVAERVVKVTVGTATSPPTAVARPVTWSVYRVEAASAARGKTEICRFPWASTKRTATGALPEVPTWKSWTLPAVTVAGFRGSGAVMVIGAFGSTPSAPSAGFTVAAATAPARVRSSAAVCPAVTATLPVARSAVWATVARRLAVPATAGRMYWPVASDRATKGSAPVETRAATGPPLDDTRPATNPTGADDL